MKRIFTPFNVKLSTTKPVDVVTGNNGLMYPKADGWYFKGADGNESALTNEIALASDFNFANLSSLATGSTILIKYPFNLGGGTVTLPAYSKLSFIKGGSITNGTINSNNTFIQADESFIGILNGITFSGNSVVNPYILPEWFGSISSGYNWQPALQYAITLAAQKGAAVQLANRIYQYQGNVQVPAGVTINGVGRGETALNAGPTKQSILNCTGPVVTGGATPTRALEIIGSFVTLSNFTVMCESRFASNIDAIVFNAVGDGVTSANQIESANVDNVLVHSSRTGLYMVSGNNGAIGYCNFNNFRTRDCQYHIHLQGLSANPIYGNIGSTGLPFTTDNGFINSNKWSGIYCSGFALSVLLIETQIMTNQVNSQNVYVPVNNLIFDGVVFESQYSQYGHIKLTGGGSQVRMHDIRVEASQQASHYPAVPLIYLDQNVNGCFIDMDQAAVPVVNLGFNNTIQSKGSKISQPSPNSDNLYKNAALVGLTTSLLSGSTYVYSLPEWTIEEQCVFSGNTYAWRPLQTTSAITLQYSANPRQAGYYSLQFSVPPQYQLRIYQNIDRATYMLTDATVNAYVLANNQNDVTFTYQDQITSILSSGASFGTSVFGGTYEPVGGWFKITNTTLSNYYRIALFCQNTQDYYLGSNINFSATEFSFVKGIETKNLPARYVTDTGATIYGVMGYNIVENIQPVTNPSGYTDVPGSIILPQIGNVFEINDSNFNLQRINYAVNRFPRGSLITLFFKQPYVTVVDSAFINITKPFVSEVGSTLTLYSRYGTGLWEEVGRYSKNEHGYTSYDLSGITAASEVSIPLTGSKYINFTNGTSGVFNIQKINNIGSTRFDPDTKIHLSFTAPNGNVTLLNTGYINLANYGTYYPNDGDWIELITSGDGTWTEVARKHVPSPSATVGNQSLDLGTPSVLSGNILSLPLTGENTFSLTNTGSSGQTITRINDSSNVRFNAGSLIVLDFSSLTSAVTITNGAYITLARAGNWSPANGDWIVLYTTGGGTWVEIARKPLLLPPVTKGYQSIQIQTILASQFLTLPQTGENYFTMDCSVSGGTIARINNASTIRLPAGTVLVMDFSNISAGTAVTMVNSGYITLAGGVNYIPSSGHGISFITRGDGTWIELYRF